MDAAQKKSAPRVSRTWIAVAVWAGSVGLFGGLLLNSYHGLQVAHLQRGLAERGALMLDVGASMIRAHLRNLKYNPDQLNDLFGRLESAPLVGALALRDGRGELLLQAGAEVDWDKEGDFDADFFVRSQSADLLQAPPEVGMQHHRPPAERGPFAQAGWHPFPEGPHTLLVALETGRYQTRMRAIDLQCAGAGAVLLLAIVLGGMLLLLRRSREDLRTDLAVARERAAHHEQLAQLGAGLAHETKNPLGLVRGMAQGIFDTEEGGVREEAGRIIDETDRIVGQINGFLSLARPPEPRAEAVSLDDLFADLADLVRQEAREQGATLSADGAGLVAQADAALLRRAILNVLINAVQACREGDAIQLLAARTEDGIAVRIEDTGPGIAAEDLARVKEPYFSRSPGGTGLGLAIVDEIARAHGWTCAVASTQGEGTQVSFNGLREVG